MRIPTTKIYRAFPELDRFSDAQCELLLRRVQLKMRSTLGWNLFITWVFVVSMAVVFLGIGLAESLFGDRVDVAGRYELFELLGILLLMLGLPAGVSLLLRDAILRRRLSRSIDYELDRIRCLHCKYILIGQVATDGRVGCPECGASFALAQLGITESDLLPPGNTAQPTQAPA